MNRKARQLTDYVPQYVSLYHVDYRDDLDEHEDIQEECIRSNSLEKLYEKAYEWYEEQEGYLEETRKSMEADSLAGQFEEHEDEIRDLIYDRNDSDPAKDLIRNSSVTNFFYSLGVEISGYQAGIPQRGESTAMACYKVRRALHLKKGQFDEKIEELVENAAYGGELRVYFNAMFDRLVSEDAGNDFRSIRFYGNVVVAIADSLNCGFHWTSRCLSGGTTCLSIRRYTIPMRMKSAAWSMAGATPQNGKQAWRLLPVQSVKAGWLNTRNRRPLTRRHSEAGNAPSVT